MKKLLIIICCSALFAVCISGCTKEKPEVELTKDNFSKLNSLNLVNVYISCPHSSIDPNSKEIFKVYSFYFPINITKGEVILLCVKEANQTSYDIKRTFERRDRQKGKYAIFIFETKKIKYSIPIFWDNESAYGFWWESPELLSIFRGWGLFEDLAKADPNWPPVRWIRTPSGERVPFTTEPNSSRFRKVPYSRGRDINEVDDESKDVNTPAVGQ
ncbi:MAG: hypothetical protein WC476_11555 [Phycisphaerae bacterium]|jgi:hypothetical protein